MQVIQGSNAGGRIGEALGLGLQQLAQNKLEHVRKQYDTQYERAQYARGVEPLVGPEIANFLSNLSPEHRESAISDLPSLMALLQNRGQQGGQNQEAGMAALAAPQPNEQQSPQFNAADLLGNASVTPMMRQALSKSPIQLGNEVGTPQQAAAGIEQVGAKPQPFPAERAQLIQNILTSPKERREKEKLALEAKKINSREDLAAWKNTLPYREEILKNEEASREALHSIKSAQELEKSGDFPSQQFASFLKGADWEDVPGFLSGKAEAYNKILANFQRGAKDIYGGRITNFEMEQFLKTIPTLQHTPEGRSRIWSMMKTYYRGGKEKAKIERQVIKENGGVPPQDLHEKVNEKFKPVSKDLSKRFKKELEEAEKLASSGGSRAGSVAAYGAGKALGAIPGLVKSGAKIGAGALGGAALGSFIPGVGTGIGALLGGYGGSRL